MKKLLIFLILILSIPFLSYPVSGMPINDCEEMVLAYQAANRGDLIFIMPLQDNGAFEFSGRYVGHWVVLRTDGQYYDPQTNTESDNPEVVYGKNSQSWDISKGEHPPFSLWRN